MTTPGRLAGFGAAVALVFAGAAAAGQAIDPAGEAALAVHAATGAQGEDHTGMAAPAGHGAQGGDDAHPVRGLAVAQDGLRIAVDDAELAPGRVQPLAFRILDERGRTVRGFDVEHTKRLHLIVVRRDLTGFQHLHPRQDADGAWTTPLRLAQAGSYRLLADFVRAGRPYTLAWDLRVDGPADLQALPAPAVTARTQAGYDVRLAAVGARPGRPTELRFTVARDRRPVRVQPYLGAGGHLVALREGDLAFLHVHPTTHDGTANAISFAATFPTTGRYRLFLQFQHEGRVQTAAFTLEVR